MIPKIIHYCWLSSDPYPEKIQKCMDSWKKYLPDYNFVHWNFTRFPRGKSKWVDQAFDTHKYAFASDYIRLYALYNYGGIYLDCDVEVLKPFDNLLELPYFIGQENTPSGVEAATLGCEKGNALIKDILDSYNGANFINSDGTYNMDPLPYIFRKCIEAYYTYNIIDGEKEFVNDGNVINVFPIDWFSPKHYATKELNLTKNTYSIHHFEGSWLDKKSESASSTSSTITRQIVNKPNIINNWKQIIKLWCKRQSFSNSIFAKFYFSNYKKNKLFFADDNLYIFDSDYSNIATLGKALIKCEYEFIRKEESIHKDIKGFYPIARVSGSTIEIHVCKYKGLHIYTKDEILSLIRNM